MVNAIFDGLRRRICPSKAQEPFSKAKSLSLAEKN